MTDLCSLYDEMTSKRGFDDGNMQPAGAHEARDALVRLINRHLPGDSPVEAYGFDRPGMHNSCLILFRRKGAPEDLVREGYFGSENEPENIEEILTEAEENEELVLQARLHILCEEGG